jgi:RNA polymerase sigma factor (sigma-70 family)
MDDLAAENERLFADCANEGSPAQAAAFAELWPVLYRIAYAMLARQTDADALAADCTQAALIKIYRNLARCESPARFRAWCGQIVRRTVIDELRRPALARRAALPADEAGAPTTPPIELNESADLRSMLVAAIAAAPLSERSRRVVLGRFFEEQVDEALAQAESALSDQPVLPSHVQVTRAKNLAKLRADSSLVARLREFL